MLRISMTNENRALWYVYQFHPYDDRHSALSNWVFVYCLVLPIGIRWTIFVMAGCEDGKISSTGIQIIKIIVTNLGITYVSHEEKAVTCFRNVKKSLLFDLLQSNQRTKFTDVGFQESTIANNTLIFFLHHVNDFHVMSGHKSCIPSCNIGLVKTLTYIVEYWPPKIRFWGFKESFLSKLFSISLNTWSLVSVKYFLGTSNRNFIPWRYS